jgi:hypothetical protein
MDPGATRMPSTFEQMESIHSSLPTQNQRSPIKRLRRHRLQFIPLLPPRPPTCILKSNSVCDFVLLAGHVSP